MPSGIKDGRTKKKYYCKEPNCNNEIHFSTALYRQGRCKHCAQKIKSLGRKLSKEARKKISEKAKLRVGILNPNFGNHWRKKDAIIRKQHYCKCGNKISRWTFRRGGVCRHCARIKENLRRWKDINYRNKVIKAMFRGLNLKPNKPEKKLISLLNEILPNEYEFVGDGKVILDGFNPDFINCNGQKKIIELYGDYWHNLPSWKERDKRRLIAYRKLGYKTLIIWEHELKDLDKLQNKILEFNNAKC